MEYLILLCAALPSYVYFSIFLHEFGHFIACRLLRVPVLEFSVGRGKILFQRTDRQGTTWRFRLFPISGYVDHLNYRCRGRGADGEDQETQPLRPATDLLITAAGPLMDILLFGALLVTIALLAATQLPARIGEVLPHSPAAAAGMISNEVVVAINDHPVTNWREVFSHINAGAPPAITLETASGKYPLRLPAAVAAGNGVTPKDLGVLSDLSHYNLTIGFMGVLFPAEAAGLRRGDRINKINAISMPNWNSVNRTIIQLSGTTITLAVQRGATELSVPVTLNAGKSQFAISGLLPRLDLPAYQAKREIIWGGFWSAFGTLGDDALRFPSAALRLLKHDLGFPQNFDQRYARAHPALLEEIFTAAKFKFFLLLLAFLSLLSIVENLLPSKTRTTDGGRIYQYVLMIVAAGRARDLGIKLSNDYSYETCALPYEIDNDNP